jgi:hypothetical protein
MQPDANATATYVQVIVQLGSFGVLAYLIYKWPPQIISALEALRKAQIHADETVSKLGRAITLLTIQLKNPQANVGDEANKLAEELKEHDLTRNERTDN